MGEATMTSDNVQVANDLLSAGREAFAKGQDAQAHTLWRQAAALHPENEAIWVELLSVVKSVEDRRVCLENILTINPRNTQAKNELQIYNLMQGQAQARKNNPERTPKPPQAKPPHRFTFLQRLFWMLVTGIGFVVLLLLIELALEIL